MENDQHNSGNKHAKEVQLDLNTSITTQKGRALVGRLETYKFLNKGVVIPMIKKGWGLDQNMEIHDMPEKNAYLFRFTNADDYHRVLKGHDSRNCKFQPDLPESDAEDHRTGNGLGTMHVKPIDEVLVIHDHNWDEAAVARRKPVAAAEITRDHRRIDGDAISGKSNSRGVKSGDQIVGHQGYLNGNPGDQIVGHQLNPNGNPYIEDASIKNFQGNLSFTALLTITKWIPTRPLDHPESAPPRKPLICEVFPINTTVPLEAENQEFNISIPASTENQNSPNWIISTQSAPYHVDSPASENEGKSTVIPLMGLSPVTAVTAGLQLINLKRLPEPLDEAQRPNPPKKRLTYIEELAPDEPLGDTRVIMPGGSQRLNVQKLKRSMRKKKKTPRSIKQAQPINSPKPISSSPPESWNDLSHIQILAPAESLNNANGCHQAAIGSP
ncbi:hypothetical protein K1719_009661 [Acacia pycnantha]|nr:hypothetical protein K1719_009661 [Acacia pycnantha]